MNPFELFPTDKIHGDKPDILTEAKLESLREAAKRYRDICTNGCPFKPGEFVTPRKDASCPGHGELNIVLEVFCETVPHFDGEIGSSEYGKRFDMRVACRSKDTGFFVMYWVESVEWEPYEAGQ